jgi:hypothetical protein
VRSSSDKEEVEKTADKDGIPSAEFLEKLHSFRIPS